jgi:NTP pyrophosphatase (non-canonical NTP hydrolase)
VWPGLSKLIEEMGEAGQVAGKLLATGGEAAHWDGTDLRQRLSEETADVAAAIDFVTAVNGLDTPEWRERRQKKAAQFRKWHHEQGDGSGCSDES